MSGNGEPERDGSRGRIVLNPTSGAANHTEEVRQRAAEHGYDVVETERAGHAVELAAAAAAEGVELLVACGGDGTVEEVVRGICEAGSLDDVTLGVLPAGTANILAGKLGIDGVSGGFDTLENGETRRFDLGMAGDEPFLKSCIAGLPAEASAAADSKLKERLGTLSFVLTGVEEAVSFDGLHATVSVDSDEEDGEFTWEGEALGLLVGNAERFGSSEEPDVGDGLFEVVIVEEMPPSSVVAEAVADRLLDWETEHVIRLRAGRLEIRGQDDQEMLFSLDGEVSSRRSLTVRNLRRALAIRVPSESSMGAQ